MLRRSLGSVALCALFACTPAQPAATPASSGPTRDTSAAADPDELIAAAEGDPNLELALREAVSLDRQQGVSTQRKVEAWQDVVDLAGERPIGEVAAERVLMWSMVADAAQRRPEALRILQKKYEEDVARTKSGALSIQEFCEAYRPYVADLDELKVTPRYATICPKE